MPGSVEPADRPGSFVVRLDAMDQSHVDLDDPTRLAFDYVRRIGDLLDAAAPAGVPLRVLHVGGAGLTLARYVEATRPGSRQVVLEPDAVLTELVRRDLPLPRRARISVRPVDGRTGLREIGDGWAEVLVVDAFADAVVPDDLLTGETCRELARVTGDGLLVLNLVDRAPFGRARDLLAGLRAAVGQEREIVVGAETATWRGRRAGNLVLGVGGRPPAAPGPAYVWVTGPAVTDRLGGGTPT